MKLAFETALILGLFVLFHSLETWAGTPPSNDNFDNRTMLEGTQAIMAGSLAEATLEIPELIQYPSPEGSTASVWWTWTAPVSGTVIISTLDAVMSKNALYVYTQTNFDSLHFENKLPVALPRGRYVRWTAAAGEIYQFQVVGSETQGFSFRLTATNAPVIITQPTDVTVPLHGSAFFAILATGPPSGEWPRPTFPTSYQWFFNGEPISGQTFPSLIVHGATTNQAGTYSVVVSNAGGITPGGSAVLTVADTNPVPGITALPPVNPLQVRLGLTGEPGRWYKIESSTNLQNWLAPSWFQLSNPAVNVSVQRLAPTHFVRASLNVPTDFCIALLRQLNWAAGVYAIEQQRRETDAYDFTKLVPYIPLPGGFLTSCPEHGTLYAGSCITNTVRCTLEARGHFIPDPP